MDAREVYLAHHGILGQKWGRKNGPPYPLDAQDHSASEKKAGWRKSLAAGKASLGKFSKNTKDHVEKAVQQHKEKREEQKREQLAEKKRKILNSGDADEILKNKDLFTDDELRKARERIDAIRNLENAQREQAEQTFNNAMHMAKNVKDAVDLGVASYESFKKLKDITKGNAPDTQSQKAAKEALEQTKGIKITKENEEEVSRMLNNSISRVTMLRDLERMANDSTVERRNSENPFKGDKGKSKDKSENKDKSETTPNDSSSKSTKNEDATQEPTTPVPFKIFGSKKNNGKPSAEKNKSSTEDVKDSSVPDKSNTFDIDNANKKENNPFNVDDEKKKKQKS